MAYFHSQAGKSSLWEASEATGSGTRICPRCMNWLFFFLPHFLWRDTLLSSIQGGMGFVLLQRDWQTLLTSHGVDGGTG